MPVISGGGGGTSIAQVVTSAQVVPVAHASGDTVDSTTYADPVEGAGFLTTLVIPVADHPRVVYAFAVAGDAFPRWLQTSDGANGVYLGDGTFDPYNGGANLAFFNDGTAAGAAGAALSAGRFQPDAAKTAEQAPRMSQVSPKFTITSGALPTVQLVSGTGAQVSTARDTETYTPVTLTSVAGTVVVALSPDNTTYSTVMTVTPAVNASVTDVTVRVPAGWYLKMTATNATLGVTTYA